MTPDTTDAIARGLPATACGIAAMIAATEAWLDGSFRRSMMYCMLISNA
mgnify:CR=1 FL=1